MAATKRNAMHIEETRKKAQASQLVNRLRDHVLGKVEMTSTQVAAANILLKKTIPDLSSVTVSGDEDNPVQILHRIERVVVGS